MRGPLAVVRDWRGRDLVLYPVYSLVIVVGQALVVDWLRWWSIIVLIPVNLLILYGFRFDEPFRRRS